MKQVDLIVMKLTSKDINDMELGPSNEIEGLPDETDRTKLPITIDYSNHDN